MRDISQVHNSAIKIIFVFQLPGRNKFSFVTRIFHFFFFSLFYHSFWFHFTRLAMINKIFINVFEKDYIFSYLYHLRNTDCAPVVPCCSFSDQACVSQNSRELLGPENIPGRFSGVFLGSRKVFLKTPEIVPSCLPIFSG